MFSQCTGWAFGVVAVVCSGVALVLERVPTGVGLGEPGSVQSGSEGSQCWEQ